MTATRPLLALAVLMALAGVAHAQATTPAAPAAPAAPAPPAAPAEAVKVITSEPLHAVVLPMKGSYVQHPEAFQRLGTMLSTRGVAIPESIFARYFSDPSVGEANLVWEVGCAVPADFKVEAPFEIRDVAATLTAVKQHTGPMEELATAWPELIQWVMSNGYQPAGPAMQTFTGFMTGSPQVELRLPVQK